MTTSVSKPALNLREKLTQLQHLLSNAKPDLVRLPSFKNLVTNGGFDSDTAWTKGTGWTISGGLATKTTASAADLAQQTQKTLHMSHVYSVGYVVSGRTAGYVNPRMTKSGLVTSGVARTADGSYVDAMYPPADGSLFNMYANSAFLGSVDDVSVWEADPADGEPWLRLPYGFKVNDRGGQVFRDGLLLSLDAYEEITVLGQTWIKPMTAPGPNTAFDIWAGV